MRTQRAQIVGNALGQHRHDAVGEIDRIAAHQRFAIERRAGRHVMRDIGDGDGDDEAAVIARVVVGFGMHRVVVVLGVGRIDGDQRQLAPVLAPRKRRGLRGFGVAQGLAAEHARDAVGVDGDQADGFFARQRAEPFDDAADAAGRSATARDSFDRDQIAFLGVAGGARRNVNSLPSIFLSTGSTGRRHSAARGRCRARAASAGRSILMTRPE